MTYRLLTFILFLAFSFYSCNQIKTSTKTGGAKPNIIYILADDLGYGELGAYGQEKIETPNIDKLANNGMLFTQHYTGAPVCAPARAILLTGKHSGHSFIRGNDEWASRGEKGDVWNFRKVVQDSTLEGQRPLPEGTETLASRLKKAGYQTAMFGKWGLGAPHTHSIPTKMGFDYFFGYNCQRQAHTYTPLHLYENENRFYLTKNDTIVPGTILGKDEDPYDLASYKKYQQAQYAPEVSFEKMISYLDDIGEDPFFLYWATPIPHAPLQAPENWVNYYLDKFGEEEPYASIPEKGIKFKGYFPNRYPHATYAAMISYLDENLGKLIDYLKKNGKYENTLIIFTSDNGPTYNGGTDSPWFDSAKPFNSEYGRGKGFLYEGGIRVPMIACWPEKIAGGSKTDHISSFYDVMPTLSEVAGVSLEKDSDGISFFNTLKQKVNQEDHPYLYWEYPEYGGQVAVRKGPWKILWKEIHKGNKDIEIYNLEDDPSEQKNLADQYPEMKEELYAIIRNEHISPEIKRFKIEALEEICKNR